MHQGNLTAKKLQELEIEIEQYQDEFFELWRSENLDAVICPPYPSVAGPLGSIENTSGNQKFQVVESFIFPKFVHVRSAYSTTTHPLI